MRRFPVGPLAALWSLFVYTLVSAAAPAERPERALERMIRENNFSVERDLPRYVMELGVEFLADLKNLDGTKHWIDMGSGEGVAIENYFQIGTETESDMLRQRVNRFPLDQLRHFNEIRDKRRADRAAVTGITYVMRRRTPDYGGKLRHLVGRYFEIIPNNEIGEADLICDVAGVFSYSHSVDVVLRKYFELLNPGGKTYIRFGFGLSQNKVRIGAREISLEQWVRDIRGIRVTKVNEFGPTQFTLKIEKTERNVTVPRLRLVSTDDHTTPRRIFEQLGE